MKKKNKTNVKTFSVVAMIAAIVYYLKSKKMYFFSESPSGVIATKEVLIEKKASKEEVLKELDSLSEQYDETFDEMYKTFYNKLLLSSKELFTEIEFYELDYYNAEL